MLDRLLLGLLDGRLLLFGQVLLDVVKLVLLLPPLLLRLLLVLKLLV